MLLKIYTDQGSLRVIEGIEKIEVHPEVHYLNPYYGVGHGQGSVPPKDSLDGLNLKQGGMFDYPDFYDDYRKTSPVVLPDILPEGLYPIRFIDYAKSDGYWKRVAIGFRGMCYLCNDQGKTIERILEPSRQAA